MRLDCGASQSVVNSGDLRGDRVRGRRSRSCGSTALTMMRGDAGGDQVVHQPLLDGGRRLLGIFELQIVVRQLALRLLDAGFGDLPEVRGAVDDEGQRLLVGRRGRGDRQRQRGRQASNDHTLHSVIPPICVQTTAAPASGRNGFPETDHESRSEERCTAIGSILPADHR